MRTRIIVKWLLGIVGVLLGLVVAAVLVVYIIIGRDLSRTFEAEVRPIDIPEDAASIAEGERLTHIRGCFNGCHGETVNGELFFDAPDGTRLYAPDLALAVRTYTVPELEAIIRQGVRPDGRSLVFAMPSAMFWELTDDDLAAIIAYLRTQKPGAELGTSRLGPLARLFLFQYRQELGTILAAEEIEHEKARANPAVLPSLQRGRYLAKTICTECHGLDLRGMPMESIPSLAIVAAYSEEAFFTLMREGVPIGDRELDLMARVARGRTAYFTDDEILALHRYLQTLAGTATTP